MQQESRQLILLSLLNIILEVETVLNCQLLLKQHFLFDIPSEDLQDVGSLVAVTERITPVTMLTTYLTLSLVKQLKVSHECQAETWVPWSQPGMNITLSHWAQPWPLSCVYTEVYIVTYYHKQIFKLIMIQHKIQNHFIPIIRTSSIQMRFARVLQNNSGLTWIYGPQKDLQFIHRITTKSVFVCLLTSSTFVN